jgi:hypothetical protein
VWTLNRDTASSTGFVELCSQGVATQQEACRRPDLLLDPLGSSRGWAPDPSRETRDSAKRRRRLP